MPFTFKKAQRNVALFSIFGLLFLIAITVFILKGNNIFERKLTFYTYFTEGHSITSGMTIKYKGFLVGKVTKATLLPDDIIRVRLVIYKKYKWLMKHGAVVKISSSLLGSTGIVIDGSKEENPQDLEEFSVIYSSEMDMGQEILAAHTTVQTQGDDLTQKAQEVIDMLLEFKPLIRSTLYNVKVITGEIATLSSGLNGKTESLLAEKIFMTIDSAYASLENVNKMTEKLNSDDNSIGKLLNDQNQLFNKLDKLVTQINTLLKELESLPDDLDSTMLLVEKNLIQLKYVLENVPLIPKQKESSTSIETDNRG